jgi:hypothetical protein
MFTSLPWVLNLRSKMNRRRNKSFDNYCDLLLIVLTLSALTKSLCNCGIAVAISGSRHEILLQI